MTNGLQRRSVDDLRTDGQSEYHRRAEAADTIEDTVSMCPGCDVLPGAQCRRGSCGNPRGEGTRRNNSAARAPIYLSLLPPMSTASAAVSVAGALELRDEHALGLSIEAMRLVHFSPGMSGWPRRFPRQRLSPRQIHQ